MNWSKREKWLMTKLGFKPQPGSGSGWLHKEDGENDALLAQLKSTEGASIRVTREVWRDLWMHAKTSHKTPVLVLDFVDGETLIVCRPRDMETITQNLTLED